MVRIFVKNKLELNSSFVPGDEECHYLLQVLRMRPGEEIDIVDGTGVVYHGVIGSADKKTVSVDILNTQQGSHEMETKITLYQSVAKGEKMDLAIQKSVELGVHKIVPVLSDRCVVKLDGKGNKTDRWQKIALEAARQSGRDIVPVVTEPVPFKKAVASCSENLKMIPWEEVKGVTIRNVLTSRTAKSIAVFIGPEGGFTPAEADLARSCDITPVTLGKRILRSETAGPAVIAMITYELEL